MDQSDLDYIVQEQIKYNESGGKEGIDSFYGSPFLMGQEFKKLVNIFKSQILVKLTKNFKKVDKIEDKYNARR